MSPIRIQPRIPGTRQQQIQQQIQPTSNINFEDCIRRVTKLEYIKPIYSKPKNIILRQGEEIFDKEWTLYEAKPNVVGHPPILILDTEGYVNPGRDSYPLQPYVPPNMEDFKSLWQNLMPAVVIKQVKKICENYTQTSNFDALTLLNHNILHTPVPRLKKFDVLDNLDWISFVENEVLSFQAEKDERIQLVFKATLPRGVEMKYNAHTLMSTGSGTGKSYFYDRAGIRKDKVTAVSLIGTISKEGVIPGLVHNQQLPLCIEQLECQSAPEILRFMLTFMEMGTGSVSTAYGDLSVEGRCTFVITANPTGYETDKIATFRSLIDALGTNYIALGRRIGLIIYGGEKEYKKVKSLEPLDEVEWNKRFEFYRAVEEYAYPVICALFKQKKVRTWLETPINNYEINVEQLASKIDDKAIAEFLRTHGSGAYKHIRGGALNCANVDYMKELVNLRKTSYATIPSELIEQILQKADEYLEQLVSINLESISNIPKILASEQNSIVKTIYQSLPKYLQEITVSVKQYLDGAIQNNVPIPEEIDLKVLESYHDKKYYSYWSIVAYNLSLGNINIHNNLLDKYFGFRLVKKTEKLYTVRFTDKDKLINLKW
jgi:hypothetical protein